MTGVNGFVSRARVGAVVVRGAAGTLGLHLGNINASIFLMSF